MINVKAPSGTRVEMTNQEIAKVENIVRQTVAPKDLKLIVSNIGVIPGFSSIYTSNSGPYTATVQVALNENHSVSNFSIHESHLPGSAKVKMTCWKLSFTFFQIRTGRS